MNGISEALRRELRDPEYSEGYAESFLNSYVATQIKVIREQRKMRQEDLAREIGTKQTAVSRLENVNYSSWNINTLKKLARAFRVRLMVSFEAYGTLPDDVEHFSRESLQRVAREEDPGLAEVPEVAAIAKMVVPPIPPGVSNLMPVNSEAETTSTLIRNSAIPIMPPYSQVLDVQVGSSEIQPQYPNIVSSAGNESWNYSMAAD